MEKLRREFRKERKMLAEVMKSPEFKRVITKKPVPPPPPPPPVKFEIDPVKLEQTIKKACIPVAKKSIQVLDKVPTEQPKPVAESKPIAVVLCKAMNLNGTPCKCRAKIGKFCAKHAP